MNQAALYFLAMMQAWVPTGFDTDAHELKGARETAIETLERFESIANDVTNVVMDPNEPSVFTGDDARMKTGALILGIAFHESGFRKSVDFGTERGDNGRSWCMMQINIGKRLVTNPNDAPNKWENSYLPTAEGWMGRDLVEDREKCFRAALHIIKNTWGCGSLYDHLSVYASGSCYTAKDYKRAVDAQDEKEMTRIRVIRAASRERVFKGTGYFTSHTPRFADSVVMNMLYGGRDEIQRAYEVQPRDDGKLRQGEEHQGNILVGIRVGGHSAP